MYPLDDPPRPSRPKAGLGLVRIMMRMMTRMMMRMLIVVLMAQLKELDIIT